MTQGRTKKIGNAVASLILAILVALAFYLAASQMEGSEGVDLIGGTIYSLVLSMIVFLALVPRMRLRFSNGSERKTSTSGQS